MTLGMTRTQIINYQHYKLNLAMNLTIYIYINMDESKASK